MGKLFFDQPAVPAPFQVGDFVVLNEDSGNDNWSGVVMEVIRVTRVTYFGIARYNVRVRLLNDTKHSHLLFKVDAGCMTSFTHDALTAATPEQVEAARRETV